MVVLGLVCALVGSTRRAGAQALAFDSLEKTFYGRFGDTNAEYAFSVTNRSPNPILIRTVVPSCGCTTARIPGLPWLLEPDEGGELTFVMDIRGKRGQVMKDVAIGSTAGDFKLQLRVNLPEDPAGVREANQLLAQQNRQVVFQGECAVCHVAPTVGKMGKDLYDAACNICHAQDHRASFVPNLHAFASQGTARYWSNITVHGVTNTLMPAFAKSEGGPLSDEQIQSLVEYLTGDFRTEPVVTNLVRAAVSGIRPEPNSTAPVDVVAISLRIDDKQTRVAVDSIDLRVDGVPVLPVVVKAPEGAFVSYLFGTPPVPGSRVPVRLFFRDDTGAAQVHEWSFSVLDPRAVRVLVTSSLSEPFAPVENVIVENEGRRCKVPNDGGRRFYRLENARRIRSIQLASDAYTWILEVEP